MFFYYPPLLKRYERILKAFLIFIILYKKPLQQTNFRMRLFTGIVQTRNCSSLQLDTEKVASMQALLADNFWENCGHFRVNNKFLVVHTQRVHKLSCQSTIDLFLLENIQWIEENHRFEHFYLLSKYLILQTISCPENLLEDKNQLFLCLLTTSCKY